MARLPLRFEQNGGQWDPAVRFTARSKGSNLQLTAHGPAFQVGSSRVEIGLAHGNPSPVIEPLDRLPATTNYMVGPRSQWRTGIANFARVRYQGVYPGIDVVYYGNQNQLEYDFVLAAGANPDAIRLSFKGDVKVSLTPAGDLAIDSKDSQILQKAPVIYQDKRPIQGRYTLFVQVDSSGSTYEFSLANKVSAPVSGVFTLSTPPPVFQTMTSANGQITFAWSAVAGRTYQVQYTTNLTQAIWHNLGSPIPATNGTLTTSDTIGSNGRRFYRIGLLP